jgi:hypothetical protein
VTLSCNIKSVPLLPPASQNVTDEVYMTYFGTYRPTYLGMMHDTSVMIYYVHYSSKIPARINAFKATRMGTHSDNI